MQRNGFSSLRSSVVDVLFRNISIYIELHATSLVLSVGSLEEGPIDLQFVIHPFDAI